MAAPRKKLTARSCPHMEIVWGLHVRRDCTVKSTPRRLSLSLLHGDSAVAADKHYLVCDHVHSVSPELPASAFRISQSGAGCVDTVGCHTVSSVGVSVASVAVTSQKTRGGVSLLTSSVCLAACLIAGVCSGEEELPAQSGLHAADKTNPPSQAPNKHPLLCSSVHWRIHTHTNTKIPKTLVSHITPLHISPSHCSISQAL